MSAVAACGDCLRRAWLVARVSGAIERARDRREHLPEVLAAPDEGLLATGAAERGGELKAEYADFDPAAARERCRVAGVEALCQCDERYPVRLSHLRDRPAVLHVAGELDRFLELVDEHTVAIVGARRASAYGIEVATALGRGLAAAGLTVVSGMALGVDAAAHAGALEVDGPTVAVLAGGPERAYPASKRRLHERIRSQGAVVSEMPPGTGVRRWSFPARNRVIAGLCRAVVVVEAGERSGSLITASLAQEAGRDVLAVPGRVTAPQAAGTNALIVDGAPLIRNARDVLDVLFGAGAAGAEAPEAREPLSPELRGLLDAVADGRDSGDALAAGGVDVGAAFAGLGELELLGYVRRIAGGRYVPLS